MKKLRNNTTWGAPIEFTRHERGVGLIVLIMVLAFLLTVGIALITTTSTGPQVAGNIRTQEQAFNAAEAGFDAAWIDVGKYFVEQAWTSFDTHYLKEPYGIDLPLDDNYFRKLTNEELLELIGDYDAGTSAYANILFYKQGYIPLSSGDFDPRFNYTAFLIDDEAAAGIPNAGDAIMVCIGVMEAGGRLITSRLEIELAVELPGT